MKIILVILICLSYTSCAKAAQEDLYSWNYWSGKSGITTGTLGDIINKYLTNQGYSGTTMDMLHKWLVDQTGLPTTYSTNDLEYAYFVLGTGNAGQFRIVVTGENRVTTDGSLRTYI